MAHATVASLVRTIESLLISNSPMESLICDHKEELCALHEKVSFLEVFLNNFEKNNVSGDMTDFEVEVKEVANAAEYTIQLILTEILTDSIKDSIGSRFCRRNEKLSGILQQAAWDIDHVCKESKKIQDRGTQVSRESLVQDFSSSTKDILNVKNTMVGREDQRERLLDLTRGYSGEPIVIPIIGMGGIGKTTLAREVYNDAYIRSHFDVCAWATVSQQHNVKGILLSLLRSTTDDTFYMEDEADLRDMLQKSLKCKRYLIVMDDIWSNEVWDDLKLCFPSENNAGSRIILTTRNHEVSCYAGTEDLSLQMDFMDQDESWNLFKRAAFATEALPSEFETIGKQIAEKCHGLPLTILVVAGLLKSKRSIEDWKIVANDVKSFVANDPEEQCAHVLGLSYNHLTSDLKTCLLYFGIFSEDSEVWVKDLIGFWMAEGFLNLEKDLEREAEKCLQHLIDRCLVLVSEKNRDGTKIRSCKVHDLIHDLCLREILRGNFFLMNDIVFEPNHVPSDSKSLISRIQPVKCLAGDEPYSLYRALLNPEHHQLTDDDDNDLLKRTRSIFFLGYHWDHFLLSIRKSLKSELVHFKLLRVLDLNAILIDSFPVQILSLIWLRYLALHCHEVLVEELNISPEICRLWNLQTFIVQGPRKVIFPEQIWGLMQLRHLKNISHSSFVLPNCPSISVDRGEKLGFSNIQTVSGLSSHCCTKEVSLGIENVKKLRICGDRDDDECFWNNLVHLHQLESLSLKDIKLYSGIPSAKAFPATLNKLKLRGTKLKWSDLDIIAELSNLEVLKLRSACDDEEWDSNVRVFTRLKILVFSSFNLKYWKATNDNFPVLERLFIEDCDLAEIPIEFADIHSLQLIKLYYCYPKLTASARRIQQEQEDLGNNPVIVIEDTPRGEYLVKGVEEQND